VYTFEKQTLGFANKDSTAQNAISLYKYPDCELIQSQQLAEHIAKRLMELYPVGTRSVNSEWHGYEKLGLFDECQVTDKLTRTDKNYFITYVRNNVDGGFRQEIKGFSM
ncbi:MAG: hypothetical protein K2K12_06030, partial [Clostridia bacterium]|nr:hypothetical protein [Clostridia bacterium]